MRNNKGFTLIELLVVIAIIGLLSTLAVVSLNNARAKSRDARRVSDIKNIQTALELYFNDCGGYPTALGSSIASPATCGNTTYMSTVPSNPTPGGATYGYTLATGGATYSLTYNLEGASGGLSSGNHTATPAGLANP